MTVFKCKMCGGTIEFEEGASVGVCDYCGSKQTLPRLDDDRRANFYDRANHFRRNNEFDKAMGIYEQLLTEDPTDAEAYWSLVLCRYGIEYVEDPATHKRVPTVNRAQFTSIFDDDNYKSALQNADFLQREIYEQEAQAINEIQKGILAISQNEEPYDVFICYKETDNSGRRTPDSVIATDLYHQLTQEGFKVFFSRITLEDKLGTAYEPYIFAALNSAKVMVALGTKPEHFNAVWVKNEWSRYLSLVKQSGGKKVLIPAYRDMDPYDLPEEFSHLQAQDMSKLGFMQDLIRGIKKMLQKDEPQPAAERVVMPGGGNMNLNAQLKRGHQALEDSDWPAADSFFDKALDLDAECGEAFMGKALAEMELTSLEQLVESRLYIPVTDTQKLQACGRNTRVEAETADKYRITGYFERSQVVELFPDAKYYESKTEAWQKRVEEESAFWESNRLLSRAQRYASGDFALKLKDARNRIDSGLQKQLSISQDNDERKKAELIEASEKETAAALQRAEERYKASCAARESAYQLYCSQQSRATTASEFKDAKANFMRSSMLNYKDSEQRAAQCQLELERLKAKEEAELERQRQEEERQRLIREQEEERQRILREQEEEKQRLLKEKAAKERKAKIKKIGAIAAVVAILVIAAGTVFTKVIQPASIYRKAVAYADAGDNRAAAIAFGEIDDYKDAHDRSIELWDEVADRNTIAAGAVHTLGLKNNGTVVAVGDNEYGQCNVSSWKDIVAIAAGSYWSVGLKADGAVVAVGMNSDNQCDVEDWKDITAISAGGAHTVGLKNDGTVVAVGNNDSGQCDVYDWNNIVAIAAGVSYTVGLKEDGTLVAVGDNEYGQCDISKWNDIVAISAGYFHIVGLKDDGTVVAVGNNEYDQCNVNGWKDIVEISAGTYHTMGVDSDGSMMFIGGVAEGTHIAITDSIVDTASGMGHAIVLYADGTVAAGGGNDHGQGEVTSWDDIRLPRNAFGSFDYEKMAKQLEIERVEKEQAYQETFDSLSVTQTVAAGAYHTVGLKIDGTVVAVGNNGSGRCDVSDWKNIVAIDAGHYHTLGLKEDGTVVAVGANNDNRCNVTGWKDIVAISAGFSHSVGLKTDGTVVAIGDNDSGQCDVTNWKDIVAIAGGNFHTVGLRADGTVIAVGWDINGVCDVGDWKDIVAIAAGGEHTVGLKSDGTVIAVGSNKNYGQCDVADWKDIVAISAGSDYTLGLKSDGTVVAVGNNESGQCDVSDWRDIVAISAGRSHAIGLKADGTVVFAGDNSEGQCDVGNWKDIKLPNK